MKKMTVTNINDIKALITIAFSCGTESCFEGTKWYSHTGKYICKSFIRDVEFELVIEDPDTLDGYRSVTVEV
jgi:hypothetical protein